MNTSPKRLYQSVLFDVETRDIMCYVVLLSVLRRAFCLCYVVLIVCATSCFLYLLRRGFVRAVSGRSEAAARATTTYTHAEAETGCRQIYEAFLKIHVSSGTYMIEVFKKTTLAFTASKATKQQTAISIFV